MSKRAYNQNRNFTNFTSIGLTSKATPPKSGNFKTNINKTKRKQII